MTPAEHLVHMAGMGLIVAVLAPACLHVALALAPGLDRFTPHPVAALGGFVVLHATVTMGSAVDPALAGPGVIVLLAGAMVFWAPVLGRHRRLPPGGRVVYLYTAMPLLDLAGIGLVATGDIAGGIAMIVGMLPMAGYTVALTWRWVCAEERAAQAAVRETLEDA